MPRRSCEKFRKPVGIDCNAWSRPRPTAFLVLTRASIISSAQLKLSLDNAWTLADLEQDHPTARLKVLVQRAQGGRQASARTG